MTNISEGAIIGISTYEIPAQKNITLTFSYDYVGNESNDNPPLSTRFLLLIDEQLTATSFNGTFLPYYDFTLHPGEKGAILVDVPPLQPGIHDVLLVQVENVDKEPRGTEITLQSANHLTLVAGGENSILPRPYTRLKADKRFWFRSPDDSGWHLVLSLDPQQLLDWGAPDTILRLPPATAVDFYMYAGYLHSYTEGYKNEPLAREQPFALVMLVDYQQVAISTETPIIYGIVTPSNEYSRLPVHLLPPQTPGLHQVVVLRVTYPGFPLCLLANTIRTYSYDVYLNRVGIDIEP